MHAYIYIYIYISVCVCNIWTNVKLLLTQRVPEALMRPALTKTLIKCLWYRWGRSSTYLLFEIYCNGTGLSQEPLSDMFISNYARLPQSGIYLFILFHPAYGDGSFEDLTLYRSCCSVYLDFMLVFVEIFGLLHWRLPHLHPWST